MKFIKLTAFLLAAFSMVACDDTTDTLGSSITNKVDNLTITDATYNVETQSLVAGPVLSKSNNGIIGRVKDPETGTYLTADYMTQMVPLSTFSDSLPFQQPDHKLQRILSEFASLPHKSSLSGCMLRDHSFRISFF